MSFKPSESNGMPEKPAGDGPGNAGLCAECRFARVVRSQRGSQFYQCTKWFEDPHFPKYPRLPVVECAGYAGKSGPAGPVA